MVVGQLTRKNTKDTKYPEGPGFGALVVCLRVILKIGRLLIAEDSAREAGHPAPVEGNRRGPESKTTGRKWRKRVGVEPTGDRKPAARRF